MRLSIKERIASFDVDPQKGFTPLCPNELPVEGGDKIVDALNFNADFASLRICSKDSHPDEALWNADDEHPPLSEIVGYDNVDMYWPKHCVVGTYGNELLTGLPDVSEYDMLVMKGCEPMMHPYGACYHDLDENVSTGVIEFLESRCVDIVIVGGLAFDFCVKTTVDQLVDAGFTVIVNMEATEAVSKEDVLAIKKEMEDKGVIIVDNCEELEKLIRALNIVYSW